MRLILTIAMLIFFGTVRAQNDSTSTNPGDGIVFSQRAPSLEIDTTDVEIKWLTWDQAMMANKLEKKKFFVMLYTDWCTWCKKMKVSTFLDSTVVEYLNRDFYPVMLNAESRDTISYKGFDFKFKESGKRGYHELAASLLNGKMNYPSFVVLDEREARLKVIQGYQNVNALRNTLIFYAHDGHLNNQAQKFGMGYRFQCQDPTHRHSQPNYLGAPRN